MVQHSSSRLAGPRPAIVDTVVEAYLRRLRAEDGFLVRDPPIADDLACQVEDVLGEALAQLDPDAGRTCGGIHSFESPRAATLMFEVALPIIAAEYAGIGTARLLDVCFALQRAIMDQVSLASRVDLMMEQVNASRTEERRRIARDLHDRLGHNLALAMQHLDLHRHYAPRNLLAARAKLDHALAALGEATRVVQHIAADLRRSTDHDGIERALRRYLRANVPPPIRATLTVTGDASALPANVADEIYLIMCEATRNAVRYAGSGELRLTMTITDGLVEASVTDSGRGFEPTGHAHSYGGGLLSMSERAELLGGTLRIMSRPGGGTTVALRVPLSEGEHHAR